MPVVQTGTYTIEVTVTDPGSGCTATSIPFDVIVNPVPANFSLSSPDGTFSNLSTATITGTSQVVTGAFTTGQSVSSTTFNFEVLDANLSKCFYSLSVPLPECEDCVFEADLEDIYCMGVDPDGNILYGFDVTYTLSGNPLDMSASSGAGPVNLYPDHISSSGPGSGMIAVQPPVGPGQYICIYFYGYDADNQSYCLDSICVDLPDCEDELEPCDLEVHPEEILCIGLDGGGNPIYSMGVHVENPTANNYELTISSPHGTIKNVQNTQMPGGGNTQLTFDFTLTHPPAGGEDICFTIYAFDPDAQAACWITFCIPQDEFPPCDEHGKRGDGEAINDGNDLGAGSMELQPNPAGEFTIVKYQFTDKPHIVQVVDLYGRVLYSHPAMDGSGSFKLDLAALPAGVYMVVARNGQGLVEVKRLVHLE